LDQKQKVPYHHKTTLFPLAFEKQITGKFKDEKREISKHVAQTWSVFSESLKALKF